jgi:hypothetical protein
MTEENNKKILHYLNLKQKLLTKKPKPFKIIPKFYHKETFFSSDSLNSLDNNPINKCWAVTVVAAQS